MLLNNKAAAEITQRLMQIPVSDIIRIKELLNKKTIKLSETDISKKQLVYWGKLKFLEGVFNFNTTDDNKGWLRFSLVEYTMLKTIQLLWKFGIDNEVILSIKDFYSKVLTYDEVLSFISNQIPNLPTTFEEQIMERLNLSKEEASEIIISIQKADDREIFEAYKLSGIEGVIIAVLFYKYHQNLMIFNDGSVCLYSDEIVDNNLDKIDYADKLKNESYVKVSLTEILNLASVFHQKTINNIEEVLGSRTERSLSKLLEKGYDIKTIRELFNDRDDIEFSEIQTSKDEIKDVVIEKALYKYNDQDFIIKIRGGKKVSITQLIIENKKK